ncbi:helix-turn-helix transcriptional regulator [Lactobacillus agrestimuris]|uniref:helix-turn-helix transcriptional regulator n=1 Tax=Lactobacillus agrestimuris TaxID=2941328 RepID=UPI0020443780|nr:hypothetical protein [Lactobacillus agrestimuris]
MTKDNILNAKDLMSQLNISTTRFYQFLHYGMPYHQIGNGRKYYILSEVKVWLKKTGYHQEKTWTK